MCPSIEALKWITQSKFCLFCIFNSIIMSRLWWIFYNIYFLYMYIIIMSTLLYQVLYILILSEQHSSIIQDALNFSLIRWVFNLVEWSDIANKRSLWQFQDEAPQSKAARCLCYQQYKVLLSTEFLADFHNQLVYLNDLAYRPAKPDHTSNCLSLITLKLQVDTSMY